MANADRPNGFRPVSTLSGSPWQASVRQYDLDASHAALGVGDLVKMTADGFPDLFTAGSTQLLGVVVGVLNHAAETILGKQGDHFMSNDDPILAGASSKSVALNTAGTILVATAPDVVLAAQEDGAVTPLVLADVGTNVEIIGGGPNATTGISGMEIDSTSKSTVATLPLRLIGLEQTPENELASVDATKPWARWLVTPANHTFSGTNVGV